jgi:uncharacterized YceG family protein
MPEPVHTPRIPEPEPLVIEPEPRMIEPEPHVIEPEPHVIEPEPPVDEPDLGTPTPRPRFAPLPDAHEPAGDGHQPREDEDDWPDEHDVPAGTRRVSGLQRTARPADTGRRRWGSRAPARAPAGAPRRRRWGRAVALIVLVLAIALIWFLVELFQPFHGSGSGRVIVRVPAHATASQIGDLLSRDGVIGSSFFFRLRVDLSGDRSKLLPGTYTLKRGMSYGSVLTVLTTPPPAAKTSELTLIPGKTRSQVGKLLSSQRIRGNYVAETRHSRLLDPHAYGAPRSTPDLEGFLFPDTYQLRDPITVSELVTDQLAQFKKQFARVSMSYARRKNLTPYDVLIIASMVEAEAATEKDRLDVASVIYNRLRSGMPLGIDATTRYAVNNYTSPLTNSQLNSSSPYNTRVHSGLPPTPIDSPSLASIQAAAHPAQTNYLYFVVTPCANGSMSFTGSYSTFLHDQALYQQARAQNGGRSPTRCK